MSTMRKNMIKTGTKNKAMENKTKEIENHIEKIKGFLLMFTLIICIVHSTHMYILIYVLYM